MTRIRYRDANRMRKIMKRVSSHPPYFKSKLTYCGELEHYARTHAFLHNNFTREVIERMHITHLGAGNGQYMDFLRRKYGSKVTSIEPNQKFVAEAREKKLNPRYKKGATAENTKLADNSQNIVLSEHLIYAGYLPVVDEHAVKEAARILTPGGYLILENTFLQTTTKDLTKADLHLVAMELSKNSNFLVFRKGKPSKTEEPPNGAGA